MQKRNITTKIRAHLQNIPLGEPFAGCELLAFGARAAVDKALSRMAETGELTRVARGIYARPKRNKYVGNVLPSPEAVARAAAHASDSTIRTHGAEALRLLGLSTQQAVQPVFLTTGPSRNLQYGKLKIRLLHTNADKLAGLSDGAVLALSALRYLGRSGVTTDTIKRIRERLSPAEYEELRFARTQMPGWLSDMFLKVD